MGAHSVHTITSPRTQYPTNRPPRARNIRHDRITPNHLLEVNPVCVWGEGSIVSFYHATHHTLSSHTLITYSHHTLSSHTLIKHSHHTLSSYTLITHSHHTLSSYTLITHSHHTLSSHTLITLSSHTLITHSESHTLNHTL